MLDSPSTTTAESVLSLRSTGLAGRLRGMMTRRARPGASYGPFNGQLVRLTMVGEILRSLRPDLVIETGTFQGETTAFLARCLPEVPIRTVEVTPKFAEFARQRLRGMGVIDVLSGSSAELLGDPATYLLPTGSTASRVFAYLDAHWGDVNPLAEELLGLRSQVSSFVAVIDDAEVPGDQGYGFDQGPADSLLRAEQLRSWCGAQGLDVAWPSVGSSEESGYRRGTAFVAAGDVGREVLSGVSDLTHAFSGHDGPPPSSRGRGTS